jgi:flagellar motor switch protein FliN
MTTAGAASNPFAGLGGGEGGSQDEQLDRAIAELRGVLHEDDRGAGLSGDFLASLGAAAPPSAPGAPASPSAAGPAPGSVIMGIPVEVQIVLGTAEMAVSELMALQKGSTVALDRRIGEPVEVVVNGRRVARGEITVLDSDPSRFGVRLTEIVG